RLRSTARVSLTRSLQPSTVPLIFFFTPTTTTEIYTLSLHDALPISFVEAVFPQRPHLRADAREGAGRGVVHAPFVRNDPRLRLGRRVVELDADEALSRRGLEVLERALVAGVVGDHQQEVRMGIEQLAG